MKYLNINEFILNKQDILSALHDSYVNQIEGFKYKISVTDPQSIFYSDLQFHLDEALDRFQEVRYEEQILLEYIDNHNC